MTAQGLPTVGYLDQEFCALLSREEAPPPTRAASVAPAGVVVYRVQGLAEVLGGPCTVRR